MILKRPPHEWIGAFRLLFFHFCCCDLSKKRSFTNQFLSNSRHFRQLGLVASDTSSLFRFSLGIAFAALGGILILKYLRSAQPVWKHAFMHSKISTYSNIQSDSSYGSILLLFWPRINSPLKKYTQTLRLLEWKNSKTQISPNGDWGTNPLFPRLVAYAKGDPLETYKDLTRLLS